MHCKSDGRYVGSAAAIEIIRPVVEQLGCVLHGHNQYLAVLFCYSICLDQRASVLVADVALVPVTILPYRFDEILTKHLLSIYLCTYGIGRSVLTHQSIRAC